MALAVFCFGLGSQYDPNGQTSTGFQGFSECSLLSECKKNIFSVALTLVDSFKGPYKGLRDKLLKASKAFVRRLKRLMKEALP